MDQEQSNESEGNNLPVLKHANQLQGLALHPKAELLKQLVDTIPTNDTGLPTYLYRADLIDPQDTNYDHAMLYLDYSQGYSALPNGDAIWTQMPNEPIDAYNAFVHYLEMPRSTKEASAPVRQLNILKPLTGKSSSELLSWSYMYYWPYRCRAYDMFVIASHHRSKELRTQKVEDTHFTRAQKFIDYAENFLEEVFADPESHELSPKEAFDMMFKMMQAQRLSVGLSPNGAHAANDPNKTAPNAPIELILRTLAKNAGIAGSDDKGMQELTQQLFQDPAMLERAQELIIRVGDVRTPRAQKTGQFLDG